ncbi:hypothetical protein D3C81_2184870 [compost metagenome]
MPELGQGEHRVADHLDPCRLLPAAADDGVTSGGLKADQSNEPGRHAGRIRLSVTLHQHGVGTQVDDLDA